MAPVHAHEVDGAVSGVVGAAARSFSVRNAVNSSALISPEAQANSRCLMRPRPPDVPGPARYRAGSSTAIPARSPRIIARRSPAGERRRQEDDAGRGRTGRRGVQPRLPLSLALRRPDPAPLPPRSSRSVSTSAASNPVMSSSSSISAGAPSAPSARSRAARGSSRPFRRACCPRAHRPGPRPRSDGRPRWSGPPLARGDARLRADRARQPRGHASTTIGLTKPNSRMSRRSDGSASSSESGRSGARGRAPLPGPTQSGKDPRRLLTGCAIGVSVRAGSNDGSSPNNHAGGEWERFFATRNLAK